MACDGGQWRRAPARPASEGTTAGTAAKPPGASLVTDDVPPRNGLPGLDHTALSELDDGANVRTDGAAAAAVVGGALSIEMTHADSKTSAELEPPKGTSAAAQWYHQILAVISLVDATMPVVSHTLDPHRQFQFTDNTNNNSGRIARWWPDWCWYLLLSLVDFVEYSFRGMGQVCFQNNSVTGIFTLAAMFYNSTFAAWHGVGTVVASNLVALAMGITAAPFGMGLYGYNGSD